MNAGAYGGEMKQVLSAVTAWFPGEGIQRLEPEALALGYRHSVFSERRGVVLEAELSLEPGEGCGIAARMEELGSRWSIQARAAPSSGPRAILPGRSLSSAV